MTDPARNRSRLMAGCAGTAMALALMLAPQRAGAQAIQAEFTVPFGAAEVDQATPNLTVVEVGTPTAVIDWQPLEDAAGNALDFLPTGTTAIFQNTPGQGQFAVLNRILPSSNGNIAVINGSVISQLFDSSGISSPGGLVAFYSPTGLLIGSTASFDVGQLLLTTLDTSDTGFAFFAEQGGNLSLTGATGSTARIQIAPGAQILATPENAYFAVVAADIEMLGTARVNGSHAYVAGEVVNLSVSNGLFNIFVPVGTAASGEVVTVNGTVGGPSSNGAGDNHMIYGVARAAADPISMLFSGNLGFDPAVSVGVINGEIILSANYNVFGRTVNTGSISDGIDAVFTGTSQLTSSTGTAEVYLSSINATSSLLAISDALISADAAAGPSVVDGNLLLVATGRRGVAGGSAALSAAGSAFTVTGDLLVSAQHYGAVSSSLQSLDEINAQGGVATVTADIGGTVTVNGNALVTADAFAGADDLNRTAGTSLGGQAAVRALGGSMTIDGDMTISARASGTTLLNVEDGAESRGGAADILADFGGSITIGQGLFMSADAFGAQGALFTASSVSNAYGGRAAMRILADGGTLTVNGPAELSANGTGGAANTPGAGSIGDGGEAIVTIDASGLITVNAELRLDAIGLGGDNPSGTGGIGRGGRASIATFGAGRILANDRFDATADGTGGRGLDGGDGLGGIAGANARFGEIAIAGRGFAGAEGFGGAAQFGNGGNGGIGRGGNAFFQADGSLTQTATLSIGGNAAVFASGIGGGGGNSDGVSIAAGRGGDGYGGQITVPNQADPAFNSGAFLLAGSDNGTIAVVGEATLIAVGQGGQGGFGATGFDGGRGGNGFGGLAQAGLALLGFDGSVGQGTASFGDVLAQADAVGGGGGSSGFDFPTGDGGNATGGFAALTVRAGEVAANRVELSAIGYGGQGRTGGIGTGGAAAALGSLGGLLSLGDFTALAGGFGGSTGFALGGLGQGGEAGIELQGMDVTVTGNSVIDAIGVGGSAETGVSGDGVGGTAFIGVTGGAQGSGTFLGNASIVANGFGGSAPGDNSGGAGGTGRGGLAYAQAQSGSTVRFGSLQVTASGRGGDNEDTQLAFVGGAGIGGTAELRSLGSGSNLIVERNVDGGLYANEMNDGGILAAIGIGGITTGGTGIGGEGQGGSILVRAALGGSMSLPANPAADPGSNGPIGLIARGYGGGSLAEGGRGGTANGGSGLIEVDSGTMTMGATLYSTFAQGGSSLDSLSNIAGGDGFGGTRLMRVLNGGTLTFESAGGISGGAGGNGSGNSDGGDGFGGFNQVAVSFATLNVVGNLLIVDQATGGNGHIGGDAGPSALGGEVSFVADQATITFTPNAAGQSALVMGGANVGGAGDVRGGSATSTPITFDLSDSTITGGNLQIIAAARGGDGIGPDAVGGNATGTGIGVNIVTSNLELAGENIIALDVEGGAGAGSASGGAAVGGDVSVLATAGTINIATNAVGIPGRLRVRSQATGGGAGTVGDATSGLASLVLSLIELNAGQIYVDSLAVSEAGSAGQVGGNATSGTAGITLAGATSVDTALIAINSDARTSAGGSSQAGISGLEVIGGSAVTVTAGSITVSADASGADPASLANGAGQFRVNVGGGNVSAGSLIASALGDVINGNPPASQLAAEGGNLNVADQITVDTYGDLEIRSFAGGIIGSPAVAGVDTQIRMTAQGTIRIVGDTSAAGGLSGQAIDLTAGRSILVNGSMAVNGGAVSLTANAGGAQALPVNQGGPAVIAMADGTSINAGTGTVVLRLLDSAGDPDRVNGAIALSSITAGRIDVRNFGASPGSDIIVNSTGVLTASGSGRAIDLASFNGEVINLAGDAGLILTGGGHYGIFAATPTGSQIGSFASYARRYNVANGSAYDAVNPGGNFAAFRIVPFLTVTADDVSRFYGDANPAFSASYAGFLPGDGIADLSGAPLLTTTATGTSNIGLFTISAALGSLLSEQGYQFNFNPGQLTITPRPIIVTADDLTRIYGNANPALTFTVGGAGLVNGDLLTGVLATTAGVTTGVGNAAITQGSLAASSNYALTFVNGQLTITPRPLTITADNLSRIYGNANPELTYAVGGAGLVNGDQLSGALATAAGTATGVGNAAITQGTLTAGSNYAISFVNGQLTITPRPLTITADDFTRIYGNANPALTFTVGGAGLVNGDQLSGALATTAGGATGVGNVAITQGTLTAGSNYAISFVNGRLTITPRPITITVDDLEKLIGRPDPLFTFTVGGDGLVNNDTLTGSLAREPGETRGTFAIGQGTLTAGPNYTTTFVPGTFTISVPPTPSELNNPTIMETIDGIGESQPAMSSEEEEERFGMDFPQQSESALIAEDPLLDEPVTSGGDASLYGGAQSPPTGGQ